MIHNNKLFIVLLFTSVLSIGSVSILLNTVKAQEGQSFSAALSGNEEVPPTESNSTGTAKFQETKNNDNESQVSYWVNITGIKEVNEAHIHNGTTGENGDIVATLSNGDSAEGDDRPPQIGFAGNITSNELQGPLEDKEISDLLSLMSDGNAYVNVHTDKYPDGAIRGQVTSATASTDAGTGTNTTSATASTDAGTGTNTTSATASTDAGTGTNTTSATASTNAGTGTNTTSATASTDAGTGTNTTSATASTDAGTGTNTTSATASTHAGTGTNTTSATASTDAGTGTNTTSDCESTYADTNAC